MMMRTVFIATQDKCMAVATEVANTRYDLYHTVHSASKYCTW